MVRGGGKLSIMAIVLGLGVFLLTVFGCEDDDGPTSPPSDQVPEGFVLIQPGTYAMGSPKDEPGRTEDETRHEVTLARAFYLCIHEVTQSEWAAAMVWNDSFFSGGARPVERVSWFDCIEFCNRRSRAEGLTPAYTLHDVGYSGVHIDEAVVAWDPAADGYRLPTEGEWECACRAGAAGAFCSGPITEIYCEVDSNLARVGWYCGNSSQQSHDVMGKQPNDWGLFDMHGGVYEWCWDWYGPYSGPETDPRGPDTGSHRVIRGGGWQFQAHSCRSANRNSFQPGAAVRHDLGFRLARSVP